MNKINICGKDVELDATEFGIYFNQLTSLPAEIGKLEKLKSFDLSDNQLTSIPAEFENLEKLKYLNLYNNELTSLPAEFGKLKKLEELDLRNNPIPKEEIEKLKELLPNCKILNDYE